MQANSPFGTAPLFERVVAEYHGERHARGLRCLDSFVAMLFCQLGQAQSLREIHEGLKVSEGKLVHLGMTKSPGHSTLSCANLHRHWQIYQELFTALVPHLRVKLPVSAKTPLALPVGLLSLDSTMIHLRAAVFDWAKYKTTTGAVRIHLLLDHDGLLPRYAVITEGKKPLPTLSLCPRALRLCLIVDIATPIGWPS